MGSQVSEVLERSERPAAAGAALPSELGGRHFRLDIRFVQGDLTRASELSTLSHSQAHRAFNLCHQTVLRTSSLVIKVTSDGSLRIYRRPIPPLPIFISFPNMRLTLKFREDFTDDQSTAILNELQKYDPKLVEVSRDGSTIEYTSPNDDPNTFGNLFKTWFQTKEHPVLTYRKLAPE